MACLALDILSFRTLHCTAADIYGRLYYLIGGGQTTTFFFVVVLSELRYGFLEFNSRRVSHVFEKVIEFQRHEFNFISDACGSPP